MEDSAVKEFFFLKKKKTISAQPAARSITRTPGSSQQQGCRQSHTCDEQTCLSGEGTRKNQDNPDKDLVGETFSRSSMLTSAPSMFLSRLGRYPPFVSSFFSLIFLIYYFLIFLHFFMFLIFLCHREKKENEKKRKHKKRTGKKEKKRKQA